MAKTDLWMPLYGRDYLAATRRLTTLQHGAYLLLLIDYWLNGPPPQDDAVLRTITGLTEREWESNRNVLLSFFQAVDGVWKQKRVELEKQKANTNQEILHLRAAKGIAGRKKKAAERATQTTGDTQEQPEVNLRSTTSEPEDEPEVEPEVEPGVDLELDLKTTPSPSPIPLQATTPSPATKPEPVGASAPTSSNAALFDGSPVQNLDQTDAEKAPAEPPAETPPQDFDLQFMEDPDKPKDLKPADYQALLQGVREVFAYYMDTIGRNPRTYTLTRLRKQKGVARLREARRMAGGDLHNAIQLLEAAVDQMASSDFHMGRDPSSYGKMYVEWEANLFKSPEQFQKWLEAARVHETEELSHA